MALAALKPATIDDWLAFDDGTDTRYELVGSRLIAMAPPSDRHGTISYNAARIIDDAVIGKAPCRPIVQAGLEVERDGDTRGYVADVVLTCEEPGPHLLVTSPRLIIEVLSPSTEGYDKHKKVPDYARLPSVEEIWLIDSRARWVLVWQRVESGWVGSLPYVASETFTSRALGIEVSLTQLYRNTGLETAPLRADFGRHAPS